MKAVEAFGVRAPTGEGPRDYRDRLEKNRDSRTIT